MVYFIERPIQYVLKVNTQTVYEKRGSNIYLLCKPQVK